jgi:CBS domain-containing protein
MRIAQVYRPGTMTCRPADTVADAAGRIAAARIGALGICAGDRLIGIITEHDLVRALADGVDPHDVTVDAYATWGAHTARLDERTSVVARRMRDLAVRRMPVIHRGQVVGMVAIQDLLAADTDLLAGGNDESDRHR